MSSSSEEDVMRIKKKLEKMMKANEIDIGVSMDMLNALKKQSIDLQILKNTGIGVVLNNLRRSCNSDDLGTLAKNLLKGWKKLVAEESTNSAAANTNGSSPNSNSNDSSSKQPMSPNQSAKPSSHLESSNGGSVKRASSDSPDLERPKPAVRPANERKFNPLARNISFTDTKDPVRIKCREMLAGALELTEAIENGAELCDVNQIACRCEDVIYQEFKNTDVKYKNRVRSRVINLKDSKNPRLRESVRLGLITPDR
jgi:transcription elongation factor S-II